VNQKPRTRGPAGLTLFLIAAVSGVLILAGCSSSSSSTTASASSPAASSLSGSASSSASGGSSSQVDAATAITQKWIHASPTLSATTPLTSPAPTGKTFVWLNCEIPACTEIGQGIKEATALLGWNLKVIQYNQANISALVPAMQQALTYHPVGVGLSGLPQAVWQTEEAAYAKAGVPIIAGFVGPVNLSSTVIGNVGDGPNLVDYGTMMANWFISDSGGTGKALNVHVDSLEILKGISDAFDSTVKSGCSACSTMDLSSTLQDVESGALNGQIVAALQRDPSIKYVASPQGGFISGLSAALASAGLKDIKIVSTGSSSQNIADVNNGTETATIGGAFQVGGFQMIDIDLRHLEGMTVDPYDGGLPKQLIVKSSNVTPANDYPPITPFISQFKALWKIS
jgi:ribose transport system substrate-binding protein